MLADLDGAVKAGGNQSVHEPKHGPSARMSTGRSDASPRLSPDVGRRKQLQRSFARPKAQQTQDAERLQLWDARGDAV